MYSIVKKSALEDLNKETGLLKRELEDALDFISRMQSEILEEGTATDDGTHSAISLKDSLQHLYDHLKKTKEEDRQRAWTSEGLAMFVDILRNNNEENNGFYDLLISTLVKYLKANQGGIFVTKETDQGTVLELKSSYAYSRKKYDNKEILPGEGLVGQCYLERETILLREVPEDYVTITSGLGEATPRCVILVPLKTNDKVTGIMEIASFKVFREYEKEFLEKISESMAISISNMLTSIKTRNLLVESQLAKEELRSQEEEIRQNLEELATAQEEIEAQLVRTKTLKDELEVREKVFGHTTILSESDKHGTITYVNDKLCEVSKYSREELMGKGHNTLRHPDMPQKIFKLMWDTIKSGQVFRGVVKNRAKDGSHYWVDATIVPIMNEKGELVKYVAARYHIQNDQIAEDLYRRQNLNLPMN